MSKVKFLSLDAGSRTATFDVNGKTVTRTISQETSDETLAEHLQALARGLAVELEEHGMKDDSGEEIAEGGAVNPMPTLTITEPFGADDVLFEGTADEAKVEMEASTEESV